VRSQDMEWIRMLAACEGIELDREQVVSGRGLRARFGLAFIGQVKRRAYAARHEQRSTF
jgi:hypothetical protein